MSSNPSDLGSPKFMRSSNNQLHIVRLLKAKKFQKDDVARIVCIFIYSIVFTILAPP